MLLNAWRESLKSHWFSSHRRRTVRDRRPKYGAEFSGLSPARQVELLEARTVLSISNPITLGTAGNSTSGTTLSIPLAQSVALGDTVIITVAADDNPTSVTVTDSKGNAYINDADVTNAGASAATNDGVRTLVFSAPVTSALATSDTITITFGAAVVAKAASAFTVSGLVTATSAVDRTSTATGVSSGTDANSGTTAATTQPNEILIGAIGVEFKEYFFGLNAAPGAGYTGLTTSISGSVGPNTNHVTMLTESQIVSATGTYSATAALTGNAGTDKDWAAAIVTYKAATLSVVVSPGSVPEDSGSSLVYTFTRDFISPQTISYSVGGTATFNSTPALSDYTQTGAAPFTVSSGSVTFGSNQTTATISITPVSDTTVEPDETVVLTINSNAAYILETGTSSATGTIQADDIGVSIAKITDAVEPATNGKFRVTLTSATPDMLDTVVNYTVLMSSTATPGSDYTTLSGTVTVLAHQTFADIDVSVIDDPDVEGTETVIVRLDGTDKLKVYVIPAADTATVNITDLDGASVSIAGTTNGSETGPVSMEFTVTQTAVSSTDTVLTYSTDGNASSGSDYTAPSGTVTIPAGSTTATITVPVINDTLLEGTETLTLTLTAISGDLQITLGTVLASRTIADNESATLDLATPVTVSEAGGSQNIGVTLTITGSGSGTFALGSGVTLSANVTQTGGLATSGADYTAFGTQTVTFDLGATTGTVKNTSLAVLEDVFLEGPETVLLTLGTLNAGGTATTLGTTANTTTITDNETGVLNIATPVTVTEAGGSQNVGVTLTITGTGSGTFALGSGVSVSANVTQTGGTATSGTDYTAFGTQTVTFNAGAATGTVRNAALAVLEDVLLEGPETVQLTLGTLNDGGTATTLGTTANTTTITDNENATLNIATPVTVTEAGGSQIVGVTLTITGTGSGTFALGSGISLTANVTQTGGTATSGADYTAFGTQSVTFDAGATTGTVKNTSLAVLEDVLLEGPETVQLTLGTLNAGGTATTLGTTANTTTITDNESATLNIATPVTVTEAGGSQNVGVTLTITGTGSGTFALGSGISLTANVTQTGGTAISATDYTAFETQTVTFDTGATTGTVKNTSLAVLEDVLLEGPETVLLTLGTLNAGGTATTLGTTANTTTITDNENATLNIATPVTVTEAGGSQNVGVTLTITGTGSGTFALGSGVTLTANVTQTGGTATSAVDYTAFGTQTVTFNLGATTGTVKNTSMAVLEDVLLEGPETVLLTLGTLNAGGTATTLGTTANTTTITDNESATLNIATPVTVTEAGGSQNVGVTLTITGTGSGTFALGSGISLTANVTQTGGTATSAADYTAFGTQTVTFDTGATTGTVKNTSLAVLEDVLLEGPETVLLTLGTLNAGGTATTLGITANTTTIADNESATLNIATPVTVTEAGGVQNIGVTLTITGTGSGTFALGSGIALTANVTQTGGTAASGADYSAFGTQTVTFNAGAATGTVRNTSLAVLEDVLLEGPETVLLTLGALSAGGTATTLGTTANTTTITDNESATLSIATPVTVTEAGGAQNIGVTLTISGTGSGTFALGSGITLAANVTQTGGTASSGTDYTAFGTQTVTFDLGATTGTVKNTSLAVLEDVLLEGPETVLLTLGILNAGGTATTLGTTANTTTITDNESAILNIATPVTVTEAGGVQNIGVTLTIAGTGSGTFALGSGISLTGNVTQTGGLATSGADYTAFGTQTVTFNAGAATGTVRNTSLAVLEDVLLEGPETVLLTLGTLNAGGTATTLGTTANTTTITDNESATLNIATPVTVTEAGGAQNIGVTLTILGTGTGIFALGSGITLTADVTQTGGTATSAADYTAFGTQTLTFNAGAATGTVKNASLSVLEDTLLEGNETVLLTLGNLNAGGTATTLGTTANSTTITDNESATLNIATPVTVTEVGGAQNIGVTLTITGTGSGTFALGSGITLTANVTQTGGTATSGADYSAFGTQTVTFNTGVATGTVRNASLGVLDDLLLEGPETVLLTLGTLNAGGTTTTLGTTANTTTITDNDVAAVTVEDVVAVEGVGLVFTVTLNNAVQGGTQVNVMLMDVTAMGGAAALVAPEDYDNVVAALSFVGNAGETKQFTVATLNDTLLETAESFTVTLDAVNPLVADADTATGTITDNETATLNIATPVTVTEAGGAQNIGVTLTITGSGSGTFALGSGITLTANVTQTGGTGTSGSDYTAFGTQTVTFNAGAATGTLKNTSLAMLEDVLLEGPETVLLTLGSLSAGGTTTTLGTTANTTTITDNESATLSIATPLTVTEAGGAQNVGVTLTITGTGSGTFALGSGITLTANVTQTGGTATSGADYTAFDTQTVTFAAGATTGTLQNASLGVLEDTLLEGSETVLLTLGTLMSEGTATTLGTTANTTTITDNETATLNIATPMTVTEAGGAQHISVTLVITGTGSGTFALGSGITLTANVTQAGGTATSGADFTAFGTQTVTFNTGATTGTVKNSTLAVLEDAVLEGPETVLLTLASLNAGGTATTLGTTANTTTITDNDTASVTVNDVATVEGVGLVFTVTLNNAVQGGTTVNVTLSDVTATGGALLVLPVDYNNVVAALSFLGTAGEIKQFTVATLPDAVVEANETFTVSLNAVNPLVTDSDTGTGTITNDDHAPVANPDSFTLALGGTVTVLDSGADSVLANDTDADVPQQTLHTVLISGPAYASTFILNDDGTFRYEHDGSGTFPDSFTYIANDGFNDSNVVTVVITIVPPDILIVGADLGTNSHPAVKVFDPTAKNLDGTQKLRFVITPDRTYEPVGTTYHGGVRVATGDINGDGVADIVTAPGRGKAPDIKIFSGINGLQIGSFRAKDLGKSYKKGVYVAVGDVTGDGKNDIVVSPELGNPKVVVYRNTGSGYGTPSGGFSLYSSKKVFSDFKKFIGGATVAVSDVNGDGRGDVIVGSGAGMPTLVRVFDVTPTTPTAGTMIQLGPDIRDSFTGGVYVAAGDLDGDGKAEIVTGSASGSALAGAGSKVSIYNVAQNTKSSFDAFPEAAAITGASAVRVAVADGQIYAVQGPDGRSQYAARKFDPSGNPIDAFFAGLTDPNDPYFFGGGLFVAANEPANRRVPV